MLLAVTGLIQGIVRDKMHSLSKSISNSPAMDEGLGLHDIHNSTSKFMGMSDVAGSHTWTHAGTIQGWAGGWG